MGIWHWCFLSNYALRWTVIQLYDNLSQCVIWVISVRSILYNRAVMMYRGLIMTRWGYTGRVFWLIALTTWPNDQPTNYCRYGYGRVIIHQAKIHKGRVHSVLNLGNLRYDSEWTVYNPRKAMLSLPETIVGSTWQEFPASQTVIECSVTTYNISFIFSYLIFSYPIYFACSACAASGPVKLINTICWSGVKLVAVSIKS